MSTVVTIAGTQVDYSEFRIELPLSPVGVVPTAIVTVNARESAAAGDALSITIDGSARFDGTVSEARIQGSGGVRVQAEHDAESLFSETVTLAETTPTDEQVLQAALTAASEGGSYTLSHAGSASQLADDYSVEDRSVLSVFRDMTDRTSRVFWIDPAGTTIHVEPSGNRGLWNSFDTQQDAVGVAQFDGGSVKTVRNAVTVNGTGGAKVTATEIDSTSISTYGRREGDSPYNVSYIRSVNEADRYARELLIPDPLASGEVVVGRSVGAVDAPQVNKTIDLTDSPKGISETGLVVEKQVIEQGRATLKVGEGSGVSLENVNRSAKSRGDVTEPGSVYNSDRIADGAITTQKLVDTAVVESKLDDLSVALSKVQDGAISETKVQDDSISTPKLQAGAVTAAKILADTITANEIAAGTITALEIAADTITANQVAANTLTADQIDVLNLDSDEIAVGFDTGDQIEFATTGTGGVTVARPTTAGTCLIGEALTPFDTGNFNFFNIHEELSVNPSGGNTEMAMLESGGVSAFIPSTDQAGDIGLSGNAWDTIRAYNYIDATDGTAIADGSDPLEGLAEGHGPPDHAKVWDDEGELEGHSLNEMARSAWEVVRAQQRVIEDLEARVEALESNA